jgi:hypothetical protein
MTRAAAIAASDRRRVQTGQTPQSSTRPPALALWLAMFFGYVQLPTRFDPLAWHIREMLFGFVIAAVAG